MVESECVLSADFNGCYYVTPAYSGTACHSRNDISASSSSSSSSSSNGITASGGGGDGDDRSRLVALINEFNTNNHGLIMTVVSTSNSTDSRSNSTGRLAVL